MSENTCISCGETIPEGRMVCPKCLGSEKTENKLVYICSPYRADTPEGVAENERKAERYCRQAIESGYIPIAPHLYFTRFLDDRIEAEREAGLQMGRAILLECSELWICGDRISAGMKAEIETAKAYGIPIREVER